MHPLRSSIILLFLLSLIITIKAQSITYRYHVCTNSTTFTTNSTYQANLEDLLSSLSSNSTVRSGFYNTSAGQDPDDVYGLFLCRGDYSTDVCRNCVTLATRDIVQLCPIQKGAVVWYDECLLRYSNQYIFSTLATEPTVSLLNTQNITGDQQSFNELVMTSMADTASLAANATSNGKKFGVGQVNFTDSQNLYTLAQCTPDLSASACSQCLQTAISRLPGCCSGKQGGRALFPSCNIRYEIYPFYNSTAVPPLSPLPPSPPPPGATRQEGESGVPTGTIIAIVAPISAVIVLFFVGCCFLRTRARKAYGVIQEDSAANEITTVESLQYDLDAIKVATNNFSDDNKLGTGGFGEVYKGTLPNGQEIAVKRLSKSSVQGAEEFKNEVLLVAKLQHRNLVRLLGFCLEGEEKILVYEFVVNKSLDYFLFDPEIQGRLDWARRYKIIGGIARGIVYLHEDSRFRIIHRDLKASNILLDRDMNPKISDFGMARIFGVDQTQGSTNRIVGTYGYMSPEYAMHGQFSVKSDMYSFGVLVLEILSGKKNSSFYQTDGAADLLSHVWKHWRDGTPMQVLDSTLTDSYSRNEVLRCIHIGLLCVQEDPADRPTMAAVVLMLNSYSVTLPAPGEPAFFLNSRSENTMPMKGLEPDQSKSMSVPWSVDEASITEVYPR